ncbi:phosphotransferase family protein [Dactylosporangium roseum]|uniref:phosphotransferase family protein n=1 Tax=Dactylosporangium roseum TaxID=47989 RepID=UPI0021B33C57|nr:aminoglycoside phosphotransferase family protein [Dactylosporangium roseum]
MRTVTLDLVDGAGELLGALPAFTVEAPWWPEVADVVAGARERFGVEVTVLRLLHADRPRPHGGTVTYLAQADGPVPPVEPARVNLAPHPHRAPYAEVGGPAESIRWAVGAMRDLGLGTPSRIIQRKTWNLSALWQLDRAAGPLWLKHLPGFLKAESEVLAWLGAVAPGAAPRLLAADGTGRQLLGNLAGEDRFGAPAAERLSMIDLLHGLQRRALDDLPLLAGRGVTDRRGGLLYDQIMIAAEPWLSEIFGLGELLAGLRERLAAVADCGVPDTLVHGDFHPGNVRSDASVPPAVLDWGDAFLGHPAFDLLTMCGGLPDEEAAPIVARWAALWRRAAPGSDPVRAAELLRPVRPLLGATSYANFIHHIEPSEWPYHAEDVPTCLRMAVAQA